MKRLLLLLLSVSTLLPLKAQFRINHPSFVTTSVIDSSLQVKPPAMQARLRWKMDHNKWVTGILLFTAGAAKGFNEILHFHYKGFGKLFPHANANWFYPPFSYKNKYKDGDRSKGPAFPFSTSLLVMFTDQYHLNNFIQRSCITAALVIKIGDRKKPFRYYLYDMLYYTACYQLGFNGVYQPMK